VGVTGLGAQYPFTNLTAGSWTVGTTGELICRRPSAPIASKADAWERLPSDSGVNWSWRDLLGHAHDYFCVSLAAKPGVPVGLWCTTSKRVLRLDGGRAYRLDFIQVAPDARGAEAGIFTLGLVAARAIECGAVRIVLGSIPGAAKVYERAGATRGRVGDWKEPHGLIPFHFEADALKNLIEATNELRET
jgi:hypothetical protein